MEKGENLAHFYERHPEVNPRKLGENNAGIGHFNVFSRDFCSFAAPYSRRDYYKISFIIGKGKLYYADKSLYIDKPALLFSNPKVPYSWEIEEGVQKGWFCLFNESFLRHDEKFGSLQHSPLFQLNRRPIFFLDEQQQQQITYIFQAMMQEMEGKYEHKYDLIRNYLHVLLHEGSKMQEPDSFEVHKNASARITELFLELLERQFPIDNPQMRLEIITAKNYAEHLSIHTNHLNRSVKAETNKTTTEIIADRILTEAKALLHHTNWSVSEIAYSLGFESQAYFANFFKKYAHVAASEYRRAVV
ncbi:MAG: AraC family transcriptional regulator [Bacteroidales bacterium 45-6]|nr:MAG: AraC family transcriptional regulator [Bacteroidales bacterium 45-6]